MAIDFYIGDEQIRLTTAYFYNDFLNWTAEQGEYPQILDHSPVHGSYVPDENVKASLYRGSVQRLMGEVERLLKRDPPDYAEDVLKEMLKGCRMALRQKRRITMDDGAWDGKT
jgi:hypothetical protein